MSGISFPQALAPYLAHSAHNTLALSCGARRQGGPRGLQPQRWSQQSRPLCDLTSPFTNVTPSPAPTSSPRLHAGAPTAEEMGLTGKPSLLASSPVPVPTASQASLSPLGGDSPDPPPLYRAPYSLKVPHPSNSYVQRPASVLHSAGAGEQQPALLGEPGSCRPIAVAYMFLSMPVSSY